MHVLFSLNRPLLPAHNPPPFDFIDDCLPILAPLRSILKFGRKTALKMIESNEERKKNKNKKRKHKKNVYTGSCVPQELVFHFSAYIALLNKRKTIDGPLVTALMNANAMLSDAMSGLERVLTSELYFIPSTSVQRRLQTVLIFVLVVQLLYHSLMLSISSIRHTCKSSTQKRTYMRNLS